MSNINSWIITPEEMYNIVHSGMHKTDQLVKSDENITTNWFTRDSNWNLVRIEKPKSLSQEELKELSKVEIETHCEEVKNNSSKILISIEKKLY